MEEQVKKSVDNVKEFWNKLDPKKKKVIGFSSLGVSLFIIAATIWLYASSASMVMLYRGMELDESKEVYAVLQEMGVPAEMDANGNIKVAKDAADNLRLELASQNYPKSTLSYDIFDSASGLTSTEWDKKQKLVLQLQDRLQDTLSRIEGVEKAVVTLNIAESNSYVWQKEQIPSSAGVLLTLRPGIELSKKQVSGVKYLVSASVPKMTQSDVKVINAKTSLELKSAEETSGDVDYAIERLNFEEQIENRLEEKVLNQLSLRYGYDQMRVSATVVLDYDKMISESMEYKPEQGNTGVIDSLEESYVKDANNYAQGIAGEDNNTDIPVIVDQDADGTPEVVDHTRNIDYAISYIKQQVQKDQAQVVSSTIAIMVVDAELTQEQKDAIIDQASKATNIPIANISVENILPTTGQPVLNPEGITISPLILIGLAIAAIVLIVIILLLTSRSKKSKAEKQARQEEDVRHKITSEEEIEERKRLLRETAEAKSNSENAITNEIREFAKTNPEITASLIRSWLKEDE